jgi:diguanylate cyclase (GGDEF)-like protein
MKVLFNYLDKIPKTAILVTSVALVMILGIIDHLTGYDIAFSIFYLLPVALVSWFDKRSHAVIISILSAVVWLWADISSGHIYSHPAIPAWNSIMRLGFFLIVAFSLLEIKRLLENEQTFARTDFLTGAANSRAFYYFAQIEIDRSVRFGRPFTIAYIDIDNFKQVNDTFGHIQGDNLLQSVAKTIKDNIRSIDIVARLGGDEFAILFTETNEENVKTALNKVQKKLLSIVKNNNWPVTFSVGAVTCYESCNLDELIKEVDKLMYIVKERGKNGIEYKIHETPIQQGAPPDGAEPHTS